MKLSYLKRLTFFFVLLTLSCEDDNTNEDIIMDNNLTSFSYDLNGETINLDVFSAHIFNESIRVFAKQSNNENVIVLDIQTSEIGTYSTSGNFNIDEIIPVIKYYPSEANKTDVYLVNPNINESASISLLNIDTVNQTISGRFSFTGYQLNNSETIDIENGVFNNIPCNWEIPEELLNGTGQLHFNGLLTPFGFDNYPELIVQRIQLKNIDYIELTFSNPTAVVNEMGYFNSENPAITLQFPTNTPLGLHNAFNSINYDVFLYIPDTDSAIRITSLINITNNDPQNRTIAGAFEVTYQSEEPGLTHWYVLDELSQFNITYEE